MGTSAGVSDGYPIWWLVELGELCILVVFSSNVYVLYDAPNACGCNCVYGMPVSWRLVASMMPPRCNGVIYGGLSSTMVV